MSALLIRRLDNIDVVVRDFAGMVDFYRDVLGLPLHPQGYEPDKGWAMFVCGDVDVVLLSVPDADRSERRRTSNYPDDPAGLHSFACQVDDLDAAVATLDERGVRWAGDVVIWGPGEPLDEPPPDDFDRIWYRFRSFYDPEDNIMHVCELHTPAGFDEARAAVAGVAS